MGEALLGFPLDLFDLQQSALNEQSSGHACFLAVVLEHFIQFSGLYICCRLDAQSRISFCMAPAGCSNPQSGLQKKRWALQTTVVEHRDRRSPHGPHGSPRPIHCSSPSFVLCEASIAPCAGRDRSDDHQTVPERRTPYRAEVMTWSFRPHLDHKSKNGNLQRFVGSGI